MSTTFFHPTRKTFYQRGRIPKNIRQHFKGRVEVWRSLRTADQEEADVRSLQLDARTKQLFFTLNREGRRMTQAQIDALVDRWLESELDYAEDCRALAGPVSDADRESQLDGLGIMHESAYAALRGNDYRKIEKDADDLLTAAGISLDRQGAEYGRLCRRLLQARIEYTKIEANRWTADEPYHRPNKNGSMAQHVMASAPAQVKASPLFSVIADKYLAENQRNSRTEKPLRAEWKKFVEVIGGDRPIAEITKADGRTYKEHLLTVRNLGLHTVSKHLSSLTALLRWAEAQGYMPEGQNPFKGLAPNKKQVRKEMNKRRPFTDEELLTVLGSKEFLTQRTKNPSRWWIVLGCLFSAAGREEIAQLVVADIQTEDGIPFIRINDDEKLDQHLKNEGSRRRVPVHSSLIQLGFLDYVNTIKQAGHVRLFPDLVKGHNGYADPVGKWWGRLMTTCGLTDPELAFHGLRHTGLTRLHSNGCPADIAEMLAGHAAGNVHGVYVHRNQIALKTLREGLEKLRYDQVVDALWKG